MHHHGYVANLKTRPQGRDDGLGLGVVHGIVLAEELYGTSAACPESGGGVRHRFATEQPRPKAEPPAAQTSHHRGLEAVRLLEIAGSDGKVGTICYLLYERRDVSRVMLAVTIELDVNVIAMLACVEVSRLHGAPYAEVAWEVYDVEPMLSAQRKRAVPGPIVHDDIVVPSVHDALDGWKKGLLLVIGRYDDEGLRCDSFNDASTARILAVT